MTEGCPANNTVCTSVYTCKSMVLANPNYVCGKCVLFLLAIAARILLLSVPVSHSYGSLSNTPAAMNTFCVL